LADKKNQVITITNTTAADFTIFVDKVKIALVVMSLLSNAVKFTPVGGTITVHAWSEGVLTVPYQHPHFVGTIAPGTWSFISVQDSGIGIPESQQRRIFDRFYQVANSLTRPGSMAAPVWDWRWSRD
jgi:signal transduction histidine kinase